MTEPWRGNEEVPEAYLPIMHAYAWVELILCGKASCGECGWDVINDGTRSPPRVVAAIQLLAASLAKNPDPREGPHNLKIMRKILTELTHPLFLTYIAGKMGAV